MYGVPSRPKTPCSLFLRVCDFQDYAGCWQAFRKQNTLIWRLRKPPGPPTRHSPAPGIVSRLGLTNQTTTRAGCAKEVHPALLLSRNNMQQEIIAAMVRALKPALKDPEQS